MPSAAAEKLTLALDIGGTGLKAALVDRAGELVGERVRIPTQYPLPPDRLVADLATLAARLPGYRRVSAGFPGVVRGGLVLTAPHFVTKRGPGSRIDPELKAAWTRFDLAGALETALSRPARVANDADIQGAAVISGTGLEMAITLGTGLGSAIYRDGELAAHLELAHHPFRRGETYNEQLGEAARRRIGDRRWNARVARAVRQLYGLVVYDHLFVGGGNSRRVTVDLGADVTIVDNSAGLLGGVLLWEGRENRGVPAGRSRPPMLE
jgi:polyphosphate glucokinase